MPTTKQRGIYYCHKVPICLEHASNDIIQTTILCIWQCSIKHHQRLPSPWIHQIPIRSSKRKQNQHCVQTFKNQLIVVYAQHTLIFLLWYQLLPQAEDSLIMLMIYPNQHMRSSMESTTSTFIHGHHLDENPLYMKVNKPAQHVVQKEMMHSTSDQKKDYYQCYCMYIMNTKMHWICKCITFVPKFCTIPEIKQWD